MHTFTGWSSQDQNQHRTEQTLIIIRLCVHNRIGSKRPLNQEGSLRLENRQLPIIFKGMIKKEKPYESHAPDLWQTAPHRRNQQKPRHHSQRNWQKKKGETPKAVQCQARDLLVIATPPHSSLHASRGRSSACEQSLGHRVLIRQHELYMALQDG